VWINQEFHRAFQVWEPQTQAVREISIPLPAGEGPYATIYLGTDARTGISVYGEDILVDPHGYVWFTEGGDLYSGKYPDHSRIVRYDPNTGEFRVYNIPGDRNLVVGMAYDTKRNRIWFTSATHNKEVYIENGTYNQVDGLVGSKLTSFDPERVSYGNGTTFDYSSASKNNICKQNESDASCYHEYPIPIFTAGFNTGVPAHVVVDGDGFVWYTAYVTGNYIGRLNPKDGTFKHYPLPAPIGTQPLVHGVLGLESGPWQIGIDHDENIVVTETMDGTISRIRTANLGASCEKLDAKGKNPCLDERIVPNYTLSNQLLHSLAFDSEGNAWFAETSDNLSNINKTNSLGYVTKDWSRTVLLPPLSLLTGDTFTGVGMTIDKNGAIWVADYIAQRLDRLQKE
jgi:streptogramin lyase